MFVYISFKSILYESVLLQTSISNAGGCEIITDSVVRGPCIPMSAIPHALDK